MQRTYGGGTYTSIKNIINEAYKDKEVKSLTNPYRLNPKGQQDGLDTRFKIC